MQKYTQLLICSIILCTYSLSAQLKEKVASLTRNLGNLQKIIVELTSEIKPPPENGKPSGSPPPPPKPPQPPGTPGSPPPPPGGPPPPPGGKGPGPGAKPTIDSNEAAEIIRKAKADGEIEDLSTDEVGKYLRKNYTVPQKQVTEIWRLATATKPSTGTQTGSETGKETGDEGPKPGTGGTKSGAPGVPAGNPAISEDAALVFVEKAINEGLVAKNLKAIIKYLADNDMFPGTVVDVLQQNKFENKIKSLLPATTKPTTGGPKPGTAAAAIAVIDAKVKQTGKFKNKFELNNFINSNNLTPTTKSEQEILNKWLADQGYL